MPDEPSPSRRPPGRANFFGVLLDDAPPLSGKQLEAVISASDPTTKALMLRHAKRALQKVQSDGQRQRWQAVITLLERITRGDP